MLFQIPTLQAMLYGLGPLEEYKKLFKCKKVNYTLPFPAVNPKGGNKMSDMCYAEKHITHTDEFLTRSYRFLDLHIPAPQYVENLSL